MADNPLYSFETRPTRQTEEAARQMLFTLLSRLGLGRVDQARLRPEDHKALLTFTKECHLNIAWYDRSRKREQQRYWGFAVFTGLVLVATPAAIFLAHHLNSQVLTAQIGVIVAGVLSAHRMLSNTFDKRNLVRHFWRAQADLKSILYSFEDTWRGRIISDEKAPQKNGDDQAGDGSNPGNQTGNDQNTHAQNDRSSNGQKHVNTSDRAGNDLNTHSPAGDEQPVLRLDQAFLDDLHVQIAQARQIKRQEQDEFFARYDSAFSNLSEILGFAGKQSTEVASALQARRRESAELLTSTRGEIDDLEARSQAIATQLDQHRRELESLQAASTPFDSARRDALISAIESLHREQVDAAFRLQTARTRLQRIGPIR